MSKRQSGKKPLNLKSAQINAKVRKKRTLGGPTFVVHCCQVNREKVTPLSETSFQTIRLAVEERQTLSDEKYRLSDICSQVPGVYSPFLHGYHRSCYQKFTNTSWTAKRKQPEDDDNDPNSPRKSRKPQASSSISLPCDECLYLWKKAKKSISKDKRTLSNVRRGLQKMPSRKQDNKGKTTCSTRYRTLTLWREKRITKCLVDRLTPVLGNETKKSALTKKLWKNTEHMILHFSTSYSMYNCT